MQRCMQGCSLLREGGFTAHLSSGSGAAGCHACSCCHRILFNSYQPNLLHLYLLLQSPAPHTPQQLTSEISAVDTVGYSHCPIHAVLDRVVVSHVGTIMALWQVCVCAFLCERGCVRERGGHG